MATQWSKEEAEWIRAEVQGKIESLLIPRSLKPGLLLYDECELELISYLQLVSEGPQVVLEIILLR
jgi:hypothetical protein